ncbi:hypothetical protein LSCM1_03766 [Leishmania martiniquensis]|uniref:Ama1 protein n=1 Tax=Leishmania martiniquensis TaxID=1580590 RepID=A0A836GR00_9TRYP|nr:hypothetical protein LSCM1_03764 [Leishmania martiniquensis]KAG5472366.1 hypothetical protein LSCM1_03765 [Leishmania martiniquensis]KAG5472367.1 hypothetical protein LSCM1_03766 [Leishmania martiniquensis]
MQAQPPSKGPGNDGNAYKPPYKQQPMPGPAVNPNMGDPARQRQSGLWHYSLCVCCEDMDSCCEACYCLPCQVSRQCNMLHHNVPQIDYAYCLLMTFCDLYIFFLGVTCVFVSETRRLARERYGIAGTTCEDCCISYWCRTCSTQQVLLEMTVMNDFPGATCYDAAPQPNRSEMV